MTSTIHDDRELRDDETVTRPLPQPITRLEPQDVERSFGDRLGTSVRLRAFVLAVLAAMVIYLVWRVSTTLSPAVLLVGIPFLLLEFWSLVSLAGTTLQAWDVDSVPMPEPATATDLGVTVLIPAGDESPEVLMPVLAAATRMRLASEVIVLDDSRREWLVGMCDELGIEYRTRVSREGGWAGQVNSALASLTTDLVVVLGADQVAEPDLIGHVLPYFDDAQLGFVHIPSDVVTADSFELVAGRNGVFVATDFENRVLARGRNRWNAAYWAEGPAVLRISALRGIGGIATGTRGERIRTSIRLHTAGWRSVHHGKALVRGRGAQSGSSFAAQVRREARDKHTALVREPSLWRLGWNQRNAYLSALSAPADRWRDLGYLLLPALMLVLGLSPVSGPVVWFTVLAVFTLVLRQAALRILGRGSAPRWSSASFSVLRMAAGLRRVMTALLVVLTILLAGLLVTTVHRATLGTSPIPDASVGVWANAWTAVAVVLVLVSARRYIRAAVPVERRRAPRIEAEGHVFLDGVRVHVLDLSLGGARLLSYGDVPPVDDYCTMTFTDPNRRLAVVTGTVVAVNERPHGREVRISLDPDQTYVLGAILVEALVR